ncbi:MAG: ABC transporter ATP-binding protein [Pseudomonadota bacterium]
MAKAYEVKFEKLSFGYPGAATILNEVDFRIGKGEVVALASAVGSGRSTFLKLLAGIVMPVEGQLNIDGMNFWEYSAIERNEMRRKICFFFQDASLIANEMIFDNLALELRYHDDWDEAKIKKMIMARLNELGLDKFANSRPATLSFDQQRKVAFIRSTLSEGSFYCWDEPTQGVSSSMVRRIESFILERKREGIPSMIASYDEDFVMNVATRLIVLKDHKICYDGEVKKELLSQDVIEKRDEG